MSANEIYDRIEELKQYLSALIDEDDNDNNFAEITEVRSEIWALQYKLEKEDL